MHFTYLTLKPLSHLTNTRYSDSAMIKLGIDTIQNESARDFLIKTWDEVSEILGRVYKLNFIKITQKLDDLLFKIIKASELSNEVNSAF